jgi:hypothetical protein
MEKGGQLKNHGLDHHQQTENSVGRFPFVSKFIIRPSAKRYETTISNQD